MATSESLDSIFTHLITEQDGVSEKEVTQEYIHKQRENGSSDIRYFPCYPYPWLISLSRNDFRIIGEKVDEIMEDIHYDRDLR